MGMALACFSSWITVFTFLSCWDINVHGRINNFIDADYGFDNFNGAIANSPAVSVSNFFSVTMFGAIGDGITDNSQAFLETWQQVCETPNGVLMVPLGTYLIKGAEFDGPCVEQTFFSVMGTIIASPEPSLGLDYWIMFNQINRFTLTGDGTFDGNGAAAWSQKEACILGEFDDTSFCNVQFPTSIKFVHVTNAIIQGIHSINSKTFHIVMDESQNVIIQNVLISAPAYSRNTDGVHIGRSMNIRLTDAQISTGDDCVSIGDGSMNINVTRVFCGPGHGISIGSLGKYQGEQDVTGVIVSNCTLTNTTNGLRIKTWAPSPPSNAYNIRFFDIIINNVANPIIFDQYYCPNSVCSVGESSVAIKDVKFVNVHGNSATPIGVKMQCSKLMPCQDIEFIGLFLTYNGQAASALCSSADTRFLQVDEVPSSCS